MAYTPQTDDGLTAGANTYEEVAFFRDYATDRGYNLGTKTDDDIKAAGVRATTYMDFRWQYDGYKLVDGQTTQFPRGCLVDADGRAATGVPVAIKNIWAEYTFISLTVGSLSEPNDATGQFMTYNRKKVNGLEKEQHFLAASKAPRYPVPDRMMRATGFTTNGQLGRAG